MAIVNSCKTLFPGLGNATEYVSLLAQNLPINAATGFALTGFVNYVRSGKVRVKATAVPASTVVSGINITGTDGTTTVILYFDTVSRTAATLFDFIYEFISELNLTTITVTVTVTNAGSAATLDLEVAGNP